MSAMATDEICFTAIVITVIICFTACRIVRRCKGEDE